MSEALRIDIVSDFTCPWCYIGKRRITAAIEQWCAKHPREPRPAVRWLPFQLNPDIPAGGISRREHLERKQAAGNGSSPEKHDYVSAVARGVGLTLATEKITVQPNTVDAHRLSGCAQQAGRQDEMVEALFNAFFMEGGNLSDCGALADLAAGAGLDREKVVDYLAGDTDAHTVARLDFEARVAGIETVPFFVFNRKVGIAGAHEVKVLLEAMEQAAAPRFARQEQTAAAR